jgi:beta-phosphoglucomutase-like phosphatase (HAD superfamily)
VSKETRSRPTAPIAAIVLDMDGLLVDSETVAGEALRLFLLGHGHEMLPSTIEGALGRRLPEAMAIVAAAYDLSRPLDELIVAFDATRLEALRGNVLAMPGAVALLDWAAGKGVPRALATSSFRGQAEV